MKNRVLNRYDAGRKEQTNPSKPSQTENRGPSVYIYIILPNVTTNQTKHEREEHSPRVQTRIHTGPAQTRSMGFAKPNQK